MNPAAHSSETFDTGDWANAKVSQSFSDSIGRERNNEEILQRKEREGRSGGLGKSVTNKQTFRHTRKKVLHVVFQPNGGTKEVEDLIDHLRQRCWRFKGWNSTKRSTEATSLPANSHLYLSSRWAAHKSVIATLKESTRMRPLRTLKNEENVRWSSDSEMSGY